MEPDSKLQGSILYVEDDETTRGAIGSFLARRVERLFLAENGRSGLQAFKEQNPDLVLTDITMPNLDGLQMAREIKKDRPHTPVIITTAYSDTQYLMDAIEIGIDGYVLKPVDFTRLFEVLRRNLNVVELRRQELRHQEQQRRLLAELQEASHKIKVLSGLLPICAQCKKIRDDHGYWTQLEEYMLEHANVSFSHGLCPNCLKAIYPEFEEPAGGSGKKP